MKDRAYTISLEKNPIIKIHVIPGHFTTSHFHLTHYIDLNNLKTNAFVARDVAIELALPYVSNTPVDTIVCMEDTEVIGAYLAEELSREGTSIINGGKDIHIITPMSNVNGNLIFQSNVQELILNKNILLLISSITGGKTIGLALECLEYYGGRIAGISALFNAFPEKDKMEINSLFTNKDIPDYENFTVSECTMCKEGKKLDAIIVNDGYTKL